MSFVSSSHVLNDLKADLKMTAVWSFMVHMNEHIYLLSENWTLYFTTSTYFNNLQCTPRALILLLSDSQISIWWGQHVHNIMVFSRKFDSCPENERKYISVVWVGRAVMLAGESESAGARNCLGELRRIPIGCWACSIFLHLITDQVGIADR